MSASQPRRLVIVESPTKAKTIRRFLGTGYQIEASMGHVRDLPASASEIPEKYKKQDWARLGVNVEEDFEALYIVSPKKKKVVTKLKDALKKADELYIAPSTVKTHVKSIYRKLGVSKRSHAITRAGELGLFG